MGASYSCGLLLDEDPESDEDPYAAAGNGPRAQTLKSLLRVAQRQRDGPPFQTCSLFRTHPISRRAVTLRPELCRLIEEFAGPRLTYANLAAIEWDRRLMKYAKTKMARELARDCGEQSLAEGMLVIAEIIFMDFDEEKRRKGLDIRGIPLARRAEWSGVRGKPDIFKGASLEARSYFRAVRHGEFSGGVVEDRS